MKVTKQKRREAPPQTTPPAYILAPAQIAALPVWHTGLFVVVAATAFLIFLRTLAPGLTFGDGPELAAAAYVMGVPHPTGYPLYMLLLRLWMFLPFGEPIVLSNMFSAVCGSVAAGFTALLLRQVLARLYPHWHTKALLVAAGCGALTTALLKLLWENSVVTEVYALHMVFAIGFVLSVLHFETKGRRPRSFLLAALCFGLAVAHHRLSSSFFLPLVICGWLGLRQWGGALALRTYLYAGLLLLLGLSFYLYIPIRAAAHPPINWSDCTNWPNFWNHISGSEYLSQRLLRLAPGAPILWGAWLTHAYLILWQLVGDIAAQGFPARLDEYLLLNTHQYFRPTELTFCLGLLILALAAVGYLRWFGVGRLTAAASGLIAAQNLAVVLLYNIADISDYTVFLFWFIYLCAFLGVLCIISGVIYPRLAANLTPRPEYAYALALVPLSFFFLNLRETDQSSNDEPERYSYFVLPLKTQDMPENAILLTSGDYDTFCSWYRQLIRKERRDVFVFGANFIGSPWYRAFFTPEQLARFGIKFHHRIPKSPEEYALALRAGIIDHNIGTYPIFTTLNDPPAVAKLAETYDFKMKGKMFILPRDILGLKAAYLWEIRPKQVGVQNQ